MTIGGSPGSHGGGMKTTTFALLGWWRWSRLRGREMTSLFGRSVREETIQRAVGLFVVVFAMVTAGIVCFVTTEQAGGDGALPGLHVRGGQRLQHRGAVDGRHRRAVRRARVVAIMLMFVGRVGPLAFAAAIALSRPPRRASSATRTKTSSSADREER